MSLIKIDIDLVKNNSTDLNQSLSKISNVKSSLSSVGNHVDPAIASRRNIRARLNTSNHNLHELDTRLRELMSFIEHAMDGYSRTETELNKKALSIGEGSHKRTLSSLFVETIHQASKMRDEFENKSKHWIDQGAQFVNDYIDRSTYKGQNQRVVQRFIKGTILDNKVTHMLIKTVDKGFQLKSHFEAGVAKGVVDSVAGLAKLGTTVSALQQKINPLTMSLEAAAYVADTASSADPLRKMKQDIIDSVEHSVEIGRNLSQIPGKLYEAVADTAHEFGQADANRKADMLGYGSEKIAEVLIPFAGVALRGAKVAEGAQVLGNLTKKQIDDLVDSIGTSIKEHPLRQTYEAEVKNLKNLEVQLREQGLGDKDIAMKLNQSRRDLGVQFKDLTPSELKKYIYELNIGRYKDELGRTFDYLMRKNIREKSCRLKIRLKQLLNQPKDQIQILINY